MTTLSRGRPREFDMDTALDAAMNLFWKRGYMQASLNELCAVMGIRHPSFYCAFGTREKLFLETLRHYQDKYWGKALLDFSEEPDIHAAFEMLFKNAATIYTRPNLPRGCFVSVSTVGLGSSETHIAETLALIDAGSLENFRKRLMRAIDDGQIPPDSDVPAISGSVMAFLKGLADIARTDICQSELVAIALRGLLLLPAKPEV